MKDIIQQIGILEFLATIAWGMFWIVLIVAACFAVSPFMGIPAVLTIFLLSLKK